MAALGVFGLIISDFTDTGAMLSNAVSAVILITLALIPLVILIKDGSGSIPQECGVIGAEVIVIKCLKIFGEHGGDNYCKGRAFYHHAHTSLQYFGAHHVGALGGA